MQAKRLGFVTDEAFLKVKSGNQEHNVLIQIKHEFSFTEKDKTFEDVLLQFWNDFQNKDLFNPLYDRLWVVKENLNKGEMNHVKSLANGAKAKYSEKDFLLEIRRIKAKEKTYQIFKPFWKE